MNEKKFILKFVLFADDDILIDLYTQEFNQPTVEDLTDINTSKQLLYYLSEIFGEDFYEYVQQDIMDVIEEVPLENITEVQIIDCEENIIYYIQVAQCIIDIE